VSKIISVSLWGNNDRYLIGAIKNADLAMKLFPGWEYRVYLGNKTPNAVKQELLSRQNTKIVDVDEGAAEYGMFWRFRAGWENNEAVIFRDADSRLSEKEVYCVNDWLNQSEKYCIIRDHPRHFDFPIMGGMWGVKGNIDAIKEHVSRYDRIKQYTIDQVWLADIVWPYASVNSKIYQINDGSYFASLRKPTDLDFIGQGYEFDDKPIYPST